MGWGRERERGEGRWRSDDLNPKPQVPRLDSRMHRLGSVGFPACRPSLCCRPTFNSHKMEISVDEQYQQDDEDVYGQSASFPLASSVLLPVAALSNVRPNANTLQLTCSPFPPSFALLAVSSSPPSSTQTSTLTWIVRPLLEHSVLYPSLSAG